MQNDNTNVDWAREAYAYLTLRLQSGQIYCNINTCTCYQLYQFHPVWSLKTQTETLIPPSSFG